MWKKAGSLKGGLPDVSLFDHSKTTCAIACCLYQMYVKENKKKNKYAKEYIDDKTLEKLFNNDNGWNKEIFSLIHGDLSGIQDFVFTITTKYATKSLKGRSFYLDFLTEYFAKYICKELNLPITNILFYGGGHFYILSYKVDENLINKLEKEINEVLFNMFRTKIYITIAEVGVTPNDFKKSEDKESKEKTWGFAKKWKEVSEKTVEKKLRRFEYKLEGLFEPYNRGSENRCVICRNEFDKNEKGYAIRENESKSERICDYCASFVALTDILKNFQMEKTIKFNKAYPIIHLTKNKDNLSLQREEFSFLTVKAIEKLESKFRVLSDENYFLKEYKLPHDSGELIIPYKIWAIAFPIIENETEKEY